MSLKENQIEQNLIKKLEELKCTCRPDIRDKATLEQNFREKFEALNRVRLTDAEFARLRDEIINGTTWTPITLQPQDNLDTHHFKTLAQQPGTAEKVSRKRLKAPWAAVGKSRAAV